METRKNRNGRNNGAGIILAACLAMCMLSCVKTKIVPRNVEITFTSVMTNEEQDSINWTSGNKLRNEFELNGNNPIRCALTVVADESVVFSQYINEHWQTIDTLRYSVLPGVTPAFRITDFNQDGNEDFMCWTHTNVHGNEWEQIFLNNSAKGELQKLHTTPDEQNVWCAPQYNAKTKIISCTEVSGAFGISSGYTYKLDGFAAVPVKKEVQDNTQIDTYTGEGAEIRKYNGKNGKWKLIKTETEEITEQE
ncbi:hypothetical protein ACLI08_06170 [Flavobacterium sp. RNTU_13]|uniref:hypothetical protein n=1 Tax=Flavobacterium sp. RNTU_13 TaxID=3375145 RepID=UPI003985AFA5